MKTEDSNNHNSPQSSVGSGTYCSGKIASLLSEALLYHSLLGNGYVSPIPPAKGLVFSAATPEQALDALVVAQGKFVAWYHQEKESLRQELKALENMPAAMKKVTGNGDNQRAAQLKEQLAKLPNPTWGEESVDKRTIVEMLKKSAYGALTFLDPFGARLAGALSHRGRLASDLGWASLTARNVESTYIRSNNTGGGVIHSLVGMEVAFNYFCSCNPSQLQSLIDRVIKSESGAGGRGHVIAISDPTFAEQKARHARFSGTTPELLEALLRRIYVLGAESAEKRVQVRFSAAAAADWEAFLDWGMKELMEVEGDLSGRLIKIDNEAPASPANAVRFGARAAMTLAFVETFQSVMGGDQVKVIELNERHLEMAKIFARHIFSEPSGYADYVRQTANLKNRTGRTNYITKTNIDNAFEKLKAAILEAPERKLSRKQVRSVKGATLNLLDELVKRGDIIELQGKEQCRMGKTTRAYTLPLMAEGIDDVEAMDEFLEAEAEYEAYPDRYGQREIIPCLIKMSERVHELMHGLTYLPVLPLSRMTRDERRMLPWVLRDYAPGHVLLRGVGRIPEPPRLLEEEDDEDGLNPLDVHGLNLWFRTDRNGRPYFGDWTELPKLGLGEVWGRNEIDGVKPPKEDDEDPPIVPCPGINQFKSEKSLPNMPGAR